MNNIYLNCNTINIDLTTIRIATIRKYKITSVGRDVKKLEPLNIAGRSVKWYSRYGKQDDGSSKG